MIRVATEDTQLKLQRAANPGQTDIVSVKKGTMAVFDMVGYSKTILYTLIYALTCHKIDSPGCPTLPRPRKV